MYWHKSLEYGSDWRPAVQPHGLMEEGLRESRSRAGTGTVQCLFAFPYIYSNKLQGNYFW